MFEQVELLAEARHVHNLAITPVWDIAGTSRAWVDEYRATRYKRS